MGAGQCLPLSKMSAVPRRNLNPHRAGPALDGRQRWHRTAAAVSAVTPVTPGRTGSAEWPSTWRQTRFNWVGEMPS